LGDHDARRCKSSVNRDAGIMYNYILITWVALGLRVKAVVISILEDEWDYQK